MVEKDLKSFQYRFETKWGSMGDPGFLLQSYLNASYQPYAEWKTWKEVSKSWRVLMPFAAI